MTTILQNKIPYDTTGAGKLPGVAPVPAGAWLHIDEAYTSQIARKQDLIAERRDEVIRLDETAVDAASELLDLVTQEIVNVHRFQRDGDVVTCSDGREVVLEYQDPLGCLSQLVQEDFCILQKRGDEHILTGALLCFPASWTLAEKFMRPLSRIHVPVPEYTDDIQKRVQRLFDGVKEGRPLWRYNTLQYRDAELFQPRTEIDKRPVREGGKRFLRSERQTILRLPKTQAVVFSIHTYVVKHVI